MKFRFDNLNLSWPKLVTYPKFRLNREHKRPGGLLTRKLWFVVHHRRNILTGTPRGRRPNPSSSPRCNFSPQANLIGGFFRELKSPTNWTSKAFARSAVPASCARFRELGSRERASGRSGTFSGSTSPVGSSSFWAPRSTSGRRRRSGCRCRRSWRTRTLRVEQSRKAKYLAPSDKGRWFLYKQ